MSLEFGNVILTMAYAMGYPVFFGGIAIVTIPGFIVAKWFKARKISREGKTPEYEVEIDLR